MLLKNRFIHIILALVFLLTPLNAHAQTTFDIDAFNALALEDTSLRNVNEALSRIYFKGEQGWSGIHIFLPERGVDVVQQGGAVNRGEVGNIFIFLQMVYQFSLQTRNFEQQSNYFKHYFL